MASTVHVTGSMTHIPTAAAVITAAAVPLAGWTVHTVVWHRRLAATRRDPLTGALRREPWTTRARHLLHRHGENTAVLLVDVDHFKAVNDQHGHAAGDQVLAATAARLSEWAGPGAAVGRIGGDEFTVALHTEPGELDFRLGQLARVLAQPVTTGGHRVDVAVSVGAATPAATGGRDLPGLLRAADTAMYATKHTGRPLLAGPEHTNTVSINGRRAGRPGTGNTPVGRAA